MSIFCVHLPISRNLLIQIVALATIFIGHVAALAGTVPNLIGDRCDVAEQRLHLCGFHPIIATYYVAPKFWQGEIDRNLVALQWPGSGETAAESQRIVVWKLARAVDDQPIVKVPELIGTKGSVAAERLVQIGLIPIFDAIEADDARVVGVIPEEAKPLYRGTAVLLRCERASKITTGDKATFIL